MKITECNIDFITERSGLIGFANLIIDNSLYISSIGIHKKLSGGYRITYPQKQNHSILYPINRETSSIIETTIFNKLKESR
ncbi:MAG: SpoVG family protein [Alphaproteobacteria bacterium]|jgi:stage V sporulation protein G|nr:SpoVG family protein [Alphaproteobacteria bacterium]